MTCWVVEIRWLVKKWCFSLVIRWWSVAPWIIFIQPKSEPRCESGARARAGGCLPNTAWVCISFPSLPFPAFQLKSLTLLSWFRIVLHQYTWKALIFRASVIVYCIQQTLGQEAHLVSVSFMCKIETELNTLSLNWNWSLQQYQPL